MNSSRINALRVDVTRLYKEAAQQFRPLKDTISPLQQQSALEEKFKKELGKFHADYKKYNYAKEFYESSHYKQLVKEEELLIAKSLEQEHKKKVNEVVHTHKIINQLKKAVTQLIAIPTEAQDISDYKLMASIWKLLEAAYSRIAEPTKAAEAFNEYCNFYAMTHLRPCMDLTQQLNKKNGAEETDFELLEKTYRKAIRAMEKLNLHNPPVGIQLLLDETHRRIATYFVNQANRFVLSKKQEDVMALYKKSEIYFTKIKIPDEKQKEIKDKFFQDKESALAPSKSPSAPPATPHRDFNSPS